MIVVTGGAGFIGANLVHGLNQRGADDILVVDDLTKGGKFRHIADASVRDYMDKEEFILRLRKGNFPQISVVFHQGACSDTMEWDGKYMMSNNYSYSREILDYCLDRKIPLIYASSASVYGSGKVFEEQPEYEHALNVYAYSKLLFDRHVNIRMGSASSQIVGLRYFNVYGPREEHKGRMASVALHFHRQYEEEGYVRLFEGSDGYGDGEQRRDFVWVGDVVDINLHFMENPHTSGIFNAGTGRSQSFNDVAMAVIQNCGTEGVGLKELVDTGKIKYVEFPAALEGRYQSFTEANIEKLRRAGYEQAFADVETGVKMYMDYLQATD
jgi:ADP-L-glycero-D-manno-heptose 6-epimerase